nr:MAG TPA: hypothetical protein [Caudoviricetes sp.]
MISQPPRCPKLDTVLSLSLSSSSTWSANAFSFVYNFCTLFLVLLPKII